MLHRRARGAPGRAVFMLLACAAQLLVVPAVPALTDDTSSALPAPAQERPPAGPTKPLGLPTGRVAGGPANLDRRTHEGVCSGKPLLGKPFAIWITGRVGSTWLTDLLHRHPNIVAMHEHCNELPFHAGAARQNLSTHYDMPGTHARAQ